MSKITEGNETITVNTNNAEHEVGLKALCDGFNAQKELRQEATILMREIRHEMGKIEQAYAAVMKPKDDLPAEIMALSLLTASLEDLRESLREHAVRVACSKSLAESFMKAPEILRDFSMKSSEAQCSISLPNTAITISWTTEKISQTVRPVPSGRPWAIRMRRIRS